MAAGAVIVTEAGGLIFDPYVTSCPTFFRNGSFHSYVRKYLNQAGVTSTLSLTLLKQEKKMRKFWNMEG